MLTTSPGPKPLPTNSTVPPLVVPSDNVTRCVIEVALAFSVAFGVSAPTGLSVTSDNSVAITAKIPRKRKDRFRPTFLSSSVLTDLRYRGRCRRSRRPRYPPNTPLSSTVALLYNADFNRCSCSIPRWPHSPPCPRLPSPPYRSPSQAIRLLYSPPTVVVTRRWPTGQVISGNKTDDLRFGCADYREESWNGRSGPTFAPYAQRCR